MKSSGTVTITTEKIQELIKNIMAGYEQYITEKDIQIRINLMNI